MKPGVPLGELSGDVVVGQSGLFDLVEIVVLAHVVEVAGQDRVLGVADEDVVLRLGKLHHALRHPADHKILPVTLHRRLMQGSRHGAVLREALFDPLHQRFLSNGQ